MTEGGPSSMGGRPRLSRHPRVLRRRRDGVSGVVAASLGVVLISVLLGMVVTFWVPAWGYDTEVAHSREAVNAFSQFKHTVELQTLAGNTNQTLGTPFPLGVGGVPLFGAETAGQLSYQYLQGDRLRFAINLTDATGQVSLSAAGSLQYTMPNRYFVRQEMAYESGAVIVSQPDGQAARLTPPFSFTNGTQGLEATLTLVSLEGTQGVVSGVDTRSVSTKLTVAQTVTFSFPALTNVSINVSTAYRGAWAGYFAQAMNASAINSSAYNISLYPSSSPQTVTLRLTGVRSLAVTVALVSVRID